MHVGIGSPVQQLKTSGLVKPTASFVRFTQSWCSYGALTDFHISVQTILSFSASALHHRGTQPFPVVQNGLSSVQFVRYSLQF